MANDKKENKVYAQVNGVDITENDINSFIDMLGDQGQQLNNPEGKKKVAEELVMRELLYNDAKEKGQDEDREFRQEMERIEKDMLKQYAIYKLFEGLDVSSEEAREYYEKNRENFKSPTTFRASHILVNTEEEARRIKGEIDEGLDFSEAAKKYSQDASKENGGDIGPFQEGQTVEAFEKACREMDINSVSDPVKSEFGYHLILLTERKEGGDQSFDQVASALKGQLLAMKQQDLYLKKADDLSKDYSVVKFY